jgi:hypothetical protein
VPRRIRFPCERRRNATPKSVKQEITKHLVRDPGPFPGRSSGNQNLPPAARPFHARPKAAPQNEDRGLVVKRRGKLPAPGKRRRLACPASFFLGHGGRSLAERGSHRLWQMGNRSFLFRCSRSFLNILSCSTFLFHRRHHFSPVRSRGTAAVLLSSASAQILALRRTCGVRACFCDREWRK